MRFTIEKGSHYSIGLWHLFPLCFRKSLHFTFKLSKECLFDLKESDDYDVNKIFGRSWGLHHNDSIRIGWVPSKRNGQYTVYIYWYNKGIRHIDKLGDFETDFTYEAYIDTRYFINLTEVRIYDSSKKFVVGKNINFVFPEFKFGYYLFPYFGGNKKSSRDMNIDIKLLN